MQYATAPRADDDADRRRERVVHRAINITDGTGTRYGYPSLRSEQARERPDCRLSASRTPTPFGQRQFERYNPDQFAAKGGIRIYKTMLDDEQ